MEKEIEFIKNLVQIPSVSTQEERVVDFLIEQAREMNFDEVGRDEVGNFVAVRGSGQTETILLGHVDTVPGDIPVKIENNQLYGRGSVDAKGSLATFVWSVHRLTDEEIKDKRIIVVGAVEEEVYTSKGARHILDKYSPEYIVIGEPSGCNGITIGYKGGVRFTYKDSQDLGHFSVGQPAVAEKAIDFVVSVKEFLNNLQVGNNLEEETGLFNTPVFELRSFNTENNGLQEEVEVNCNVRIPLNFGIKAFKDFLQQYNVEISEIVPAIVCSRANKLANTLSKSIRTHGLQSRFVKKTGTSDMNILGEHWPNVPILAYGPGDSKLDHTPDEHLDLDEYVKSIAILTDVLSKL